MDKPRIEISCSEELLRQIEEHCFSQSRVEVGGFLVGEIIDSKAVVTHVLKAKHTAAQMTQLTFTHKTWDAAFAEMAKIKPDAELIGWFHSHPNFGIFLSDHDKFIQTQFFGSDGKITIVVDPIRGKRGWFISQDKEVIPYAKEEDTNLEKLGESATNAEENIPVGVTNKPSGVGMGKVVVVCSLFSIVSRFGGFMLSSLSANSASQIANVERDINEIRYILQENGLGFAPIAPEEVAPPAAESPAPQPTDAKASTPARISVPKAETKPSTSSKPKAKATGTKSKTPTPIPPGKKPSTTSTKPTAPDTTKPTAPDTTKPTAPDTTKPTAPDTTKPTAPDTTKTTAPSSPDN